MEKVTFKINRKGKKVIPPIAFNFEDKYRGQPIYEKDMCYVPELDSLSFDQGHYKVLHYRVYWYCSTYWRYINNCPVEDYQKYIKPRIIQNLNSLITDEEHV